MDLGNTLQNFAVLQRNKNNVSEHPFSGSCKNSGNVLLTVKTSNQTVVNGLDKIVAGKAARGRVRGMLNDLPVGGAYTVILEIANTAEQVIFHDVLVGDLWLLAGQSNMADSGLLPSLSEPEPMVHAYYMQNQWNIAKDPLHEIVKAVAPVHGGDPRYRPKKPRLRGTGPGLAFALEMYKTTRIPQGVIACAHGGTSLKQWDPALKKLGGHSLYGAMYERLQDLGGKVAGMLWYQGCNETQSDETAEMYSVNTRKVFNAVRKDCKNPQLPIVFVQLGAFIASPGYTEPACRWLNIRCSQYELGQKMKNTVCVPAIDLELADQIHLSNRGVKILGKRMAEAMQYLCKSADMPPQIKFKKIKSISADAVGNTKITVTFENVAGELTSNNNLPCGFALVDKFNNYISEAINCRLSGSDAEAVLKISYYLFDENYKIAYGGNFQPHANIVDQAGRSLPCFVCSGRKQKSNFTAFVNSVLVSNAIYGRESLEYLQMPTAEELSKIKFSPATAGHIYVECPEVEPGHCSNEPRKYYFKFHLDLPEAMTLQMLFGADAAFAVYCNGEELLCSHSVNPVVIDEFAHTFKLPCGRHEFFVVFSSNSGKGWGFCCRFIRKDGKIAPELTEV